MRVGVESASSSGQWQTGQWQADWAVADWAVQTGQWRTGARMRPETAIRLVMSSQQR